jgi:hypothetical protein
MSLPFERCVKNTIRFSILTTTTVDTNKTQYTEINIMHVLRCYVNTQVLSRTDGVSCLRGRYTKIDPLPFPYT